MPEVLIQIHINRRLHINQSQKEKSQNSVILRTFCKCHFFGLRCILIEIHNPRLLSSCTMFILSVKLRRVLYGELPKVVIFFSAKSEAELISFDASFRMEELPALVLQGILLDVFGDNNQYVSGKLNRKQKRARFYNNRACLRTKRIPIQIRNNDYRIRKSRTQSRGFESLR